MDTLAYDQLHTKEATTDATRKAHVRRESTGHICTACDQCYRCKVRCSGEKPNCERCITNGSACTYSTGKPLGKPKGSKNKIQRRKKGPDQPRQDLPQDITLLPSPTPRANKRSSDGLLPHPKKAISNGAPAGYSQELGFPIQTLYDDIPDQANLPSLPGQSSLPLIMQNNYYDSESEHQEQGLSATSEQRIDDFFPSTGLTLEMDDFRWFTTSQTEQFVARTPAASLNLSTHAASATGEDQFFNSYAPVVEKPELSAHDIFTSRLKPCSCDPLGLGIIAELHTLRIELSPLDAALSLARRGLSTVSSYLQCPTCSNQISTSPSLFLACVLILQQVFACYITLRIQGTKMLASRKRADSPLAGSAICIGDFEVEGDEGCNALINAIVKSEIERGKGVIGTLEQWVERAGDGKEKMTGVLLQSLREEIGAA